MDKSKQETLAPGGTAKAPQRSDATRSHHFHGTSAPWYQGWDLSEEQREEYRNRSRESREAKRKALAGEGPAPIHPVNEPRLHPENLMPALKKRGIRTLSLFSGCGGMDLGFDLAGYTHIACYEILGPATAVLKHNRPGWRVFSEADGNVRTVDWSEYRGKVDVIHGGPPCQPFSLSGRQAGADDDRDLFPEFVRAVLESHPFAFVAENVPSLANQKFADYVRQVIVGPLEKEYDIRIFKARAADFGVPQSRTRLIFVGTRRAEVSMTYDPPVPTHHAEHLGGNGNFRSKGPTLFGDVEEELESCMGARQALGLPDVGFDDLAPTIRSGLTGPRHTTSILSSTSALRKWGTIGIWPNGVQASREKASRFVVKNGDFRLSMQDCGLLQGFPEFWEVIDPVGGAVYLGIGVLGNSVVPPVAYHIAKSLSRVL